MRAWIQDNYPPYDVWWPKMLKDAKRCIGVPYKFGSEPPLENFPPSDLDCSELIQMLYHRRRFFLVPDGSWVQHAASRTCEKIGVKPRPGDWGFWGKHEKVNKYNPFGIYHAGMIYDDKYVIEAREKDSRGRYGMVILREREKWENWSPFLEAGGWRRWEGLL